MSLTKLRPSAPSTAAGIYVRVSTQEQAEGHSLATQEEACRKFAAGLGFEEVVVYSDAGFSAKTANRPAFLRLLEDAEGGRVGTVIVWKLDRFARNRLDALLAQERLKKVGVRLQSVSEPLDDSPAGLVTEGMLQLLAEWYSRELTHKVTAGLKTRAEKGLPNAMVPFGYRQAANPTADPPTVIEEEAEHVRRAHEDFATGCVTYRQIAASWNADGLRTRHRAPRARPEDGPRLWTGDSVRRLIQNPFYKGMVTYHGEELPGRHEPLVTSELWDRAQRAGQRLRGKATSPTARFYLLSGIIRCAGCGMPMQGNHSNSGERYRYYREVAHRRGVECPQPQIAVRADLVEEMVDEIVSRFRAPKALRRRVVELMAETDQPNAVAPEVQLARAKERLKRNSRVYADLDISEHVYETERRKIMAEIDRLTIPEEKATEAVRDFDILQLAWKKATPVEKRSLGLALFEAVYFSLKQMEITEVVVAPAFRPWISSREGID